MIIPEEKYVYLENVPIFYNPLLLSIRAFIADCYSDKGFGRFPMISPRLLKLHVVNILLMVLLLLFPFHFPHTSIQRTEQLKSYPDVFNTSTSCDCFYGYCELMEILSYCCNISFHQKHFILLNLVKRKKQTNNSKNLLNNFFTNLIFKRFYYFYCILVSCASGRSSEKIVTFVPN